MDGLTELLMSIFCVNCYIFGTDTSSSGMS